MAIPLDLDSLGTPGNRRPAKVAETEKLVTPFTHGKSDLAIGETGTLVPFEKTATGTDDPGVRSRIGRRFRSFR